MSSGLVGKVTPDLAEKENTSRAGKKENSSGKETERENRRENSVAEETRKLRESSKEIGNRGFRRRKRSKQALIVNCTFTRN